MQIGALIALLRGVTLPFLASISAVFESRLARSLRAAVAIRAPICLTQTSEFLSLMNPLLTQMSGESASVEIQARQKYAGPTEARVISKSASRRADDHGRACGIRRLAPTSVHRIKIGALMSELGQKHALPRCNNNDRFTSINGH